MLALDGRPISELSQDDKLASWINSALRKIKEKPYWKLVPHDSKKRPTPIGMPESIAEYSAGILQKATGKYVFEGMEHDITYYTTINNIDGVQHYIPAYVDFSVTLPLSPKTHADLIFFMTCVCAACAPFASIQRFQYLRPNANYHYKVEDIVGDAALENVANRDVAKVNMLLFDDDMGLEEETLKNIAISHGFPNAPTMDVELLRFKLNEVLLRQTNGKFNMKRITAFLNDSKDTSLLRLRKLVRGAIEKKFIIKEKTPKKNWAWYTTNVYGEKDVHIFTMDKGTDPETALVQRLASKPKDRAMFEKHYEDRTEKASLEELAVKPVPVDVTDKK